MAPGLAQLNVYVGSSDTAILSAMSVPPTGSITGKVDAQLSCSWGWGPADPGVDGPLFKKFAAQGQSFFTAAGDSGAYTPKSAYVYPADDVNVTVVGGTDLSTTGPGGAWLGETTWIDGGGGYMASHGIRIPSWQTTAITNFNARSSTAGSTTWRNAPDVAGEANFDFFVCSNQQGCAANYGGTSFAAPMWAGYMALVNQQALLNSQPLIGFLNPTLYALGNAGGSGYSAAFHDITAGSNGYYAQSGYDLATGWGSPNGAGLIAALLGPAAPGFTIGADGALSVAAGAGGTATLTSTAAGGFNSAITLTAS
jgi:kumamolisin